MNVIHGKFWIDNVRIYAFRPIQTTWFPCKILFHSTLPPIFSQFNCKVQLHFDVFEMLLFVFIFAHFGLYKTGIQSRTSFISPYKSSFYANLISKEINSLNIFPLIFTFHHCIVFYCFSYIFQKFKYCRLCELR